MTLIWIILSYVARSKFTFEKFASLAKKQNFALCYVQRFQSTIGHKISLIRKVAEPLLHQFHTIDDLADIDLIIIELRVYLWEIWEPGEKAECYLQLLGLKKNYTFALSVGKTLCILHLLLVKYSCSKNPGCRLCGGGTSFNKIRKLFEKKVCEIPTLQSISMARHWWFYVRD